MKSNMTNFYSKNTILNLTKIGYTKLIVPTRTVLVGLKKEVL
jgi:hypothetical protein